MTPIPMFEFHHSRFDKTSCYRFERLCNLKTIPRVDPNIVSVIGKMELLGSFRSLCSHDFARLHAHARTHSCSCACTHTHTHPFHLKRTQKNKTNTHICVCVLKRKPEVKSSTVLPAETVYVHYTKGMNPKS